VREKKKQRLISVEAPMRKAEQLQSLRRRMRVLYVNSPALVGTRRTLPSLLAIGVVLRAQASCDAVLLAAKCCALGGPRSRVNRPCCSLRSLW